MPSLFRTFAALALLGTAGLAGAAHAAPFTATDVSQDNALLSQFNLVTLGNLTQTSTAANASVIQGRVLVGGNATFVGTPSVCTANCTASTVGNVDSSLKTYGALTVFGNLTTPAGSSTTAGFLNVGDGGNVNIGGTTSGNVQMGSTPTGGSFNQVGTAGTAGTATATNILNAGAIRTTQSSFAGTSYNSSDRVNFSAGTTPQVSQTLSTVFPFTTAYQTAVKSLSTGLATLPGTPNVHAQALPSNNAVFFTANNDYIAANGKKYGVVTTTLANLASGTGVGGVANGTNDATFVIVTGNVMDPNGAGYNANYILPNLNSYAGSNKVIYDFVDATTLKFSGAWNASILAPLATITQQGGSITGSVVVASINQSQELFDTSSGAGALFGGDLSGLAYSAVPEPASMALLGVGVGVAAWVRRRSRRSI